MHRRRHWGGGGEGPFRGRSLPKMETTAWTVCHFLDLRGQSLAVRAPPPPQLGMECPHWAAIWESVLSGSGDEMSPASVECVDGAEPPHAFLLNCIVVFSSQWFACPPVPSQRVRCLPLRKTPRNSKQPSWDPPPHPHTPQALWYSILSGVGPQASWSRARVRVRRAGIEVSGVRTVVPPFHTPPQTPPLLQHRPETPLHSRRPRRCEGLPPQKSNSTRQPVAFIPLCHRPPPPNMRVGAASSAAPQSAAAIPMCMCTCEMRAGAGG